MQASIFIRLRMMEASWSIRSTSSGPRLATLSMRQLSNASRKASLRARIMRHVSPAWNTWRLMISKRASSPLARLPQISVAYHSKSGSPEAQSGVSCSSASGNGLSSNPQDTEISQ